MDKYYEDYDDFPVNQKKHTGGGNKTKRKDNKNYGGSCYNSKHIRIQEAKKNNSQAKKPMD